MKLHYIIKFGIYFFTVFIIFSFKNGQTDLSGPSKSTISLINSGTLVVPPGPGDLSTVEHLKQSDDYVVEVKKSGDSEYKTCFVYESDNYFVDNYFGGPPHPQTSASFTNFSFIETSVDVRITCKFTTNSVTIRPLNFSVDFIKTGNIITFTLAAPKKLSVEVNDRKNPLFLFSDTPDVPNRSATYYYGPGVYNIGRKKILNSDESVYIAGGAVVEGSFYLNYNTTNVSITGRGILTMGEYPHTSTAVSFLKENCAIRSYSTNYMNLEGIIIANSTGWTVSIETNTTDPSHHNQYRNLKLHVDIYTVCLYQNTRYPHLIGRFVKY